jgi:hypothetical protein
MNVALMEYYVIEELRVNIHRGTAHDGVPIGLPLCPYPRDSSRTSISKSKKKKTAQVGFPLCNSYRYVGVNGIHR